MSAARYAIGVDLGTTNCALSYVDLATGEEDPGWQQTMAVVQLEAIPREGAERWQVEFDVRS
jgi:molecular chaperone DnaK (HSP70)